MTAFETVIHNRRIFAVISFFAGVLFVATLGVHAFIFERLDPNGVPEGKQREMRWAEYANGVRGYRLLGLVFLFISICGAAAAIAKRPDRVAD
jgi:hypothetical protein